MYSDANSGMQNASFLDLLAYLETLETELQQISDKSSPSAKACMVKLEGRSESMAPWRTAICVLNEAVLAGTEVSTEMCNSAIRTCAEARQFLFVLEILDAMMNQLGVTPDTETLNSTIRALMTAPSADEFRELDLEQRERTDDWLYCADRMKEFPDPLAAYRKLAKNEKNPEGIEPNLETFNSLLDFCNKSLDCGSALQIYADMKSAGVEPSMETFKNVASALGEWGKVEESLQVLEDIKTAGISPDGSVLDNLLKGCDKGANHDAVLQIYDSVEGVKLGFDGYNAVLNALTGDRRRAQEVLEAAFSNGVYTGRGIRCAKTKPDFSYLSPGAAQAAFTKWVLSRQAKLKSGEIQPKTSDLSEESQLDVHPDELEVHIATHDEAFEIFGNRVITPLKAFMDEVNAPFDEVDWNPTLLIANVDQCDAWILDDEIEEDMLNAPDMETLNPQPKVKSILSTAE